ncbi:MAG: hypothetical protein OHK0039_00980 [Bacteroidia bacterium]
MSAKKSAVTPSKKPVAKEAPAAKPVQTPSATPSDVQLPFTRMNYILLLVGVAIIAFGFFLMSLDEFVDAQQFSVSLYIAPVVVVAGFVEVIFAIMYRPGTDTKA